MFQNIRLDLFISRALLEAGHIHILQRELHPYFLRVDFSLGKQDNRLNMPRICKHIHRLGEIQAITARLEYFKVAGQRSGIAGDIGDAARRGFD